MKIIASISLRQRTLLTTALCLLLAVVWATWNVGSIDMQTAYLPWFEHIRAAGPIAAFAAPFSDYTPPYLYMLAIATQFVPPISSFAAVKAVSYVGHALLFLAVRYLLVTAGSRMASVLAMAIAIAPSLLVSPAIFIQCDAYWAAALLMALAAAMKRRNVAMFAWCGIAVGFKLQAAFAGPLFLAIALAHRVPIRFWFVAGAAFVATLVPAWLAGWPAGNLLTIYLRQVEYSDFLALNSPNVWMLIQASLERPLPSLGMIGSAAAVIASVAYVVYFSKRLRDASAVELIRAACLCAMMVPGMLPRMHERYFFFADVLTLVLVGLRPSTWRMAALVQLGSASAIMAYFSGIPHFAILGAVAMMTATWMSARPYVSNVMLGEEATPGREDHRLSAA